MDIHSTAFNTTFNSDHEHYCFYPYCNTCNNTKNHFLNHLSTLIDISYALRKQFSVMSKTNYFLTKLRFKVLSYAGKFRVIYYRLHGMVIGKNTLLGQIQDEWPANIEIGNKCDIRNNTSFWVQSPFKKENRIVIGDNVFIGRNTEFNCCDFIKIGNNCLIASSTVFVDSSHTFAKGQCIMEQHLILKGIIVDEDVWIGSGSIILLGVQLGKGCIIGAGAVVNKSIPAYEIWAGVPAKKIGERKAAFLDKAIFQHPL